jgi:hypothetical protein
VLLRHVLLLLLLLLELLLRLKVLFLLHLHSRLVLRLVLLQQLHPVLLQGQRGLEERTHGSIGASGGGQRTDDVEAARVCPRSDEGNRPHS